MQDELYIYFVTELLKGGDLFTLHRHVGNFNAKQTEFYGAQVVAIFEYLQSKDIVYRDLKPENIMVQADGYLKLIDFGFAKVIKKRTYTICGTPEYIAPEILLNEGHGKAVDWWTLGILLYEMLAGYPPFQADDPMDIYRKIINTKPKYPEGFDDKLKSLRELFFSPSKDHARGAKLGAPVALANSASQVPARPHAVSSIAPLYSRFQDWPNRVKVGK